MHEDDFDPRFYFLHSWSGREPTTHFEKQLYEDRFRLYRAFELVVPKPRGGPVADEDDRDCFLDFVDKAAVDLRVTYGPLTFVLHAYLCYMFWCRVFYCPPEHTPEAGDASQAAGTLLASTAALATSAARFVEWITAKLPVPNMPPPLPRLTSCPTRPFMFVDLVDEIQLAFYLTTLIGYHYWPALEAWMLLYGPHLVSGSLSAAFWLSNPAAGWILSGHGSATEDGRFGSWSALWTPLIFWLLFLFGRRNLIGLLDWQNTMAYDLTQLEDPVDDPALDDLDDELQRILGDRASRRAAEAAAAAAAAPGPAPANAARLAAPPSSPDPADDLTDQRNPQAQRAPDTSEPAISVPSSSAKSDAADPQTPENQREDSSEEAQGSTGRSEATGAEPAEPPLSKEERDDLLAELIPARRRKRRYMLVKRITMTLWCFLAPCIAPVIWRTLIRTPSPLPWDLSDRTYFISMTLVSINSIFWLRVWYSFLTFQHKCVVWTKPYRSGYVINNFERSLGIGFIH
ncbi:hypothetical protein HK105_202699 [Polyrhizophydium stewartii]|uniref:Uncharacterized protein n=1 Tax=Polyrhizophydium stewartii TaxID=2732419 RepID=A0ABR4NE87_9FUNG|nr:hypothetical protein HK105_004968 [Polyrhizophydium stewartii]